MLNRFGSLPPGSGDEPARIDHLILGGGLAGGLLALALARQGRGHGVTVVEQDAQLGGNHTWSFHDSDLEDQGRQLLGELVTQRWPRHVVRFPAHDRTIESGYGSISSDQFARVLTAALEAAGTQVHLGRQVTGIEETQHLGRTRTCVRLDSGAVLCGDLVLDARGPARSREGEPGGFQKFLGLELELAADGPWSVPVLMDATVAQVDGFRFTYVLPFSGRRVLIEDTIYSESPLIDASECQRGILAYAMRHGARVGRIVRRETGVLPLPTRPPAGAPVAGGTSATLRVGYGAGFFHAVTGYSLPIAVRVALAVARAASPDEARAAVSSIARALQPQHAFGRLLNRLMFDAMPAARRWTAFDRFYRLPDAVIARFYASQTTRWDRARILVGRPPAGISWLRLLGTRRPEARRVAS